MSEPMSTGVVSLPYQDTFPNIAFKAIRPNTLAAAVAGVAVLALSAVAVAFTQMALFVVLGGCGAGYLIYRAVIQYREDVAWAEYEQFQRSDLDGKTRELWLKKAAEDKLPAAMREYAKRLQYTSPYEARLLFADAAQAGDAEAQILARLRGLEVLLYKLNVIVAQKNEKLSDEDRHVCAVMLMNNYLNQKDNKILDELLHVQLYVKEQIVKLGFDLDKLYGQAKNKGFDNVMDFVKRLDR